MKKKLPIPNPSHAQVAPKPKSIGRKVEGGEEINLPTNLHQPPKDQREILERRERIPWSFGAQQSDFCV